MTIPKSFSERCCKGKSTISHVYHIVNTWYVNSHYSNHGQEQRRNIPEINSVRLKQHQAERNEAGALTNAWLVSSVHLFLPLKDCTKDFAESHILYTQGHLASYPGSSPTRSLLGFWHHFTLRNPCWVLIITSSFPGYSQIIFQ